MYAVLFYRPVKTTYSLSMLFLRITVEQSAL